LSADNGKLSVIPNGVYEKLMDTPASDLMVMSLDIGSYPLLEEHVRTVKPFVTEGIIGMYNTPTQTYIEDCLESIKSDKLLDVVSDILAHNDAILSLANFNLSMKNNQIVSLVQYDYNDTEYFKWGIKPLTPL
jgi:GTP:adenosylcobinamide-phosphate guanylyltransferase